MVPVESGGRVARHDVHQLNQNQSTGCLRVSGKPQHVAQYCSVKRACDLIVSLSPLVAPSAHLFAATPHEPAQSAFAFWRKEAIGQFSCLQDMVLKGTAHDGHQDSAASAFFATIYGQADLS